MTVQINNYLKYANLQMAAEALYGILPSQLSANDPLFGQVYAGPLNVAWLEQGNLHASVFTPTLATDFSEHWEVVEHISNTSTGFSGTLFRARRDDPAAGIMAGEFVLSFRSTEFIDDTVRDNLATNKMEISEHGWAFGQIADMEAWYESLLARGKIPDGATFSVTGYSLGGHLATAFNLLHQNDGRIRETYTFNGAGVGDVVGDDSAQTSGEALGALIKAFDRMRKNVSGTEINFSDRGLQAFYESIRDRLNARQRPTAVDFYTLENLPTSNPSEKLQLRDALSSLNTLWAELDRVTQLTDSQMPPAEVAPTHIDALRLDYQIAVLRAAQWTSGYRTGAFAGAWAAFADRNPRSGLRNIFDIYGANPPSAVANSQWHYGSPVPVYIEDQPLYRGNVVYSAAIESLLYSDIKLLVSDFSKNDFGDTHSLVLLVDSLAVMDVLSRLAPNASQADVTSILLAATASGATKGGDPGKAEGDTLETVVDALHKAITGVDRMRPGNPS